MKRLAWALVVSLTSSVSRADEPQSGPKVGDQPPGFSLQVATGDDAGKTVDYLKAWKDKPVLVIFVGEMTRPGFGLLRPLDKYARLRQPEGLQVLIVRVTDDREAAARHARLLYEMYEIKSIAGTLEEGKAGPAEYGLHEEAQMTVVLLDKEHKVAFNLPRRAPERRDFDAIREGIDKLLGPSPVPFP
ncbi:MAG: hypothetical protein ACKV0T_16000 [Planctomycetales bacterium]